MSAITEINALIETTSAYLAAEVLSGNVVKEAWARGELVGLHAARAIIESAQRPEGVAIAKRDGGDNG